LLLFRFFCTGLTGSNVLCIHKLPIKYSATRALELTHQ